jgi:hypothetical protein
MRLFYDTVVLAGFSHELFEKIHNHINSLHYLDLLKKQSVLENYPGQGCQDLRKSIESCLNLCYFHNQQSLTLWVG